MREIGDPGVVMQGGNLGCVLAHPQIPNGFGGKGLRSVGHCPQQQQREIGAHRFVHRCPGRIAEGSQRPVKCRNRAGIVGPFPEWQVGMLAGTSGIESRPKETSIVRTDQHQARTLVGMRGETGQPVHVRAGAERQKIGAGFRHSGAQAGKARGDLGHGAGSGTGRRDTFPRTGQRNYNTKLAAVSAARLVSCS